MANLNPTRAEMEEEVILEMQLDPGLISARERQRFINDCIDDLGMMGLFEKNVTLPVDAEGFISLPDDLTDILQIRSEGRLLRPVPSSLSTSYTGMTPQGYVVEYDKVRMFPKPSSGEVTLLYSYKPPHLTEDTDQPEIPNGFSRLFIDYVVGHCHRKNGNIGLYREYVSAYIDGKESLRHELTKRINARVTVPHNQEYPERNIPSDDVIL